MPDLAAWLPLLAVPFDAEATSTPEVDALDAEQSRFRLQSTVTTFLERMLMMPTLIVVEDAHWVDDASRLLLRYVAASQTPRPWFLLVTTRPSADSLVERGGPGERLELAPLDVDSATALALAVAAEHALSEEAVEDIAFRAAGNPLFLRELVAAARADDTGDLPESVETLLTTRIDTLAPPDRMLLRYAAVVGPVFRLDLVGEILADEVPEASDPERWEPLAEFVQQADDGEPPSGTISCARPPTPASRTGADATSTAASGSRSSGTQPVAPTKRRRFSRSTSSRRRTASAHGDIRWQPPTVRRRASPTSWRPSSTNGHSQLPSSSAST